LIALKKRLDFPQGYWNRVPMATSKAINVKKKHRKNIKRLKAKRAAASQNKK